MILCFVEHIIMLMSFLFNIYQNITNKLSRQNKLDSLYYDEYK